MKNVLMETESVAQLLLIEEQEEVGSDVSFPCVMPARPTPQLLHAYEAEKDETDGTILLVEDELTIRALTRMYLERNGYRVLEANNGTRAIGLWKKHGGEIDLVLTDLVMPGGPNGYELVERLRADRPDLKCILVSGHGADLPGEATSLVPSANFLQKPYRLNNLAAMVHDCLFRQEAA
jgi:CheY-like chemotaxis protein